MEQRQPWAEGGHKEAWEFEMKPADQAWPVTPIQVSLQGSPARHCSGRRQSQLGEPALRGIFTGRLCLRLGYL